MRRECVTGMIESLAEWGAQEVCRMLRYGERILKQVRDARVGEKRGEKLW